MIIAKFLELIKVWNFEITWQLLTFLRDFLILYFHCIVILTHQQSENIKKYVNIQLVSSFEGK